MGQVTGITDYDHVDPEFKDAEKYDHEKMTLLCRQCHGKVITGMLSKATMKAPMKNPKYKQQGFSNESFDFGLNHPTILVGGNVFEKVFLPVIIKGVPKAGTNKWDVEVIGNLITVREKSGKIHLCLAAYLPEGLVLEKLDTVIHGSKVIANHKKLEVIDVFKNKIYDGSINFSGNEISDTPVGFNLFSSQDDNWWEFLIQMILIF